MLIVAQPCAIICLYYYTAQCGSKELPEQGSIMANTKPNEINLKITQKELEDGKIQLTVTVPASATDDILKGALFVLAMQNKLDMQNIKLENLEEEVLNAVGEPQYRAFANHYAMNAMAPFAISQKNIEPIMEPQLNSGMEITRGKDFSFVAIVTPKPHYELSSYDPVTVKIPKITITEEEIDNQILNLAERSATTAADEGAEVAGGSEISFGIETSFKDDGEKIPHLTAEKRIYQIGSGFLPEEFDANLLGMKADESKTFDFDIPGIQGAEGAMAEPRTATTTVNIIQVNKRVVPAITNAWVEVNMPEAKNVEGLRKMMREQGMEYKTKERENMKFFMTASVLAERFKGYIADEIYEYTSGDMVANLKEQLKQNGMTLPQYIQSMGMEEQQFNMQMMMQVRETLRQSFSLDALARHLKLTVSEEDISDTLSRMAPGNEERARADIEGSGRSYLLREAATRTKANKWLVETATFEESE